MGLQALSYSECPSQPDIGNCANANLRVGDLCEGEGECGTNQNLDNCGGYDVYRVTVAGSCSYQSMVDTCKQARPGYEWTCASRGRCDHMCGRNTFLNPATGQCEGTAMAGSQTTAPAASQSPPSDSRRRYRT